MEKFAIDTCVVFVLMDYNDYYEKGEQEFRQKVAENQELLDSSIRDFQSLLSQSFIDKHGKLDINKQFDKYKQFNTNRRANLRSWIEKEQNKPIKDLNKINVLTQELDKLIADYDLYNKIKVDYKANRNVLKAAVLFEKCVKGEVKLCITPSVLIEVRNHMEGSSCDGKKYSEQQVVNIAKYLTYISIDSFEVTSKIDDLATAFRTNTKTNNMTPMSNDINSLEFFGDATIAAEAVFCGLNLITLNEKDFIFYNGIEQENENKRNSIKQVSERTAGTTTAVPISIDEFLQGKYPEPEAKQGSFKLERVFEDICFDDRYELTF